MSGYRRHIMAKLAQQEYIEGYAIQIGGAYPAVVSLRINNVLTNVQVNQDNGYFRWNGKITTLSGCLLNNEEVGKVKVRTNNIVSMYQIARRCQSVTEIDCRGVVATDTYYAFGINSPDYNNGYRMNLQRIFLPIIASTTANSNNCVSNCRVLTDVDATLIANSVSLLYCPLTLQSAVNVLRALQDLQGGSATITFSETTSALVQADTTAMNLVAQAQANGWTITFN